MWNNVCETLIAESDERDLRDWVSTEEDDDDFEEVIEDMTLSETVNVPLREVRVGSKEGGLDVTPQENDVRRDPTNSKHCTLVLKSLLVQPWFFSPFMLSNTT